MLIDAEALTANNGKTFVGYDNETYAYPFITHLQEGAYETGLNPHHVLEKPQYEQYPKLGKVSEYSFGKIGSFSSYGVCDDLQNLLAACPELVTSERQFVITLCPMRSDEQCEEGGWRWHKWGPYVGEQTPTCEYLYDEPLIDLVYVYQIFERIDVTADLVL